MRVSLRAPWLMAMLIAMLLVMVVVPAAQAAPEPAPAVASCGYWYTVQPGDSWSRVSARTGVSVAALQAANPGLVRPPRNWLYVGDSLWIPCASAPPPPPPSTCGYWYTVQPGDSWSVIARRTGTSVQALQAANPAKVRPGNIIYAGESLWIPCSGTVPPPGPPPPGPPPPHPPACAYFYTVQPGDSWSRISSMTGFSISALQAANPALVRPGSVLYVGDTMCIPVS